MGLIRTILIRLEKTPHDALALLARIGIAVIFWRPGMDKMTNWTITDKTYADFIYKFDIPLLSSAFGAEMAVLVEHVSPILLVIGLGARAASASLIGVTLTILFFVHAGKWPDFTIWGFAMIYIITMGPGRWSVDHLIRRRLLP
jgi:putative oxidoreductase